MKLFVNRDKPAAAQEDVVTAAGNAPEKIITEVNDKVVAMLKRSGEAGELVLQTDNLVKKYRQRTVANHVSINVRQGEIVGLLGPNGAGKTTTFYMTTGLVTPKACAAGNWLLASGGVGVSQTHGGEQHPHRAGDDQYHS